MDTFKTLIAARNDNLDAIRDLHDDITLAVSIIVNAFKCGKRLFICGNGGSAADAQHMAAEFLGKFKKDRKALPAIALTTDTSALTAIANDWEYSYVFARQLEGLMDSGDVLLAISTSGNSENVVRALKYAHGLGTTISLTSGDDSKMTKHSDLVIPVGAVGQTPIIQERMLMIEHIICELVEDAMCSDMTQTMMV